MDFSSSSPAFSSPPRSVRNPFGWSTAPGLPSLTLTPGARRPKMGAAADSGPQFIANFIAKKW
jgi:hypothetical protein